MLQFTLQELPVDRWQALRGACAGLKCRCPGLRRSSRQYGQGHAGCSPFRDHSSPEIGRKTHYVQSDVVAVWRFGASVPRSQGGLVRVFGVLVCHRRSHPHDSVQIRSRRGITFSLFGCARTVRISQVKTTKKQPWASLWSAFPMYAPPSAPFPAAALRHSPNVCDRRQARAAISNSGRAIRFWKPAASGSPPTRP